MSFDQFILKERYRKVKGLGDRLVLIKEQINWKPFVPMVASVFYDNKETGGRPHTDELVIVRSLVLQGLYGLSDQELEFQVNDRLSFQNFVGFPDKVPDFTTIWKIRGRLQEEGVDVKIWNELQRQLDTMGYKVQSGVIQDATIIKADLGRKRYSKEKHAKKQGEKVRYTKKQHSHIDRDARFTVKHDQVYFGYKSHIKMDTDHHLVRRLAITPANVHDGNIDLCEPDDVAMYRDRGYCGKPLKYANVNDRTMIRKDSNKDWVKYMNNSISKKRAIGERPFAVVKEVFNGARTKVKTLARVAIKELFKYFGYNLYQLVTLKRKQLAVAM
jgi:IS5 family transposase